MVGNKIFELLFSGQLNKIITSILNQKSNQNIYITIPT